MERPRRSHVTSYVACGRRGYAAEATEKDLPDATENHDASMTGAARLLRAG